MIVEIDEKDLKKGILGLVVALVEIVKEALQLQAVRRMEAGSLTEEEVGRLGEALLELDASIERIKMEMGVVEAVRSVREQLDRLVEEAVGVVASPARWQDISLER